MRVALVALLVTPGLLAGCAENQVGAPILITVTLDREELRPGAVLNATVTVENRGTSPYPYYHPGCPPDLVRVVANGSGGDVRLYEYGEEPMVGTCAVRATQLAGGEQHTVHMQWNGRTSPDAPGPHGGDHVAPGNYVVRAELATVDTSRTYPAEAIVTVR